MNHVYAASLPLLLFSVFQLSLSQDVSSSTWHDPSSHRREMIAIADDVQLEVLDWGGTGRPIIFLSGLGNTAHIWDDFAPKFTGKHHVYAITRRGFGRSTHAASGYTPASLADDILAVMDRLKIEKPVVIGHSIGGEELSSIGTRHPERVSALIYLDAAYTYAFYDAAGDYASSLADLRQKIDALALKPEDGKLMDQVRAALPGFEANLSRKADTIENPLSLPYSPPSSADKANYASMLKRMSLAVGGFPPEAELHESFLPGPEGGVGERNASPEAAGAISKSYERFTTPISLPILAIMGYPQSKGTNFHAETAKDKAAVAAADANQARQIDALEIGQPTAHVVRLADANHYIFISDEAQVFMEMEKFLATLP